MNKIKIEITPNGWESTVIIDGKEYKKSIKRSMLQQAMVQ